MGDWLDDGKHPNRRRGSGGYSPSDSLADAQAAWRKTGEDRVAYKICGLWAYRDLFRWEAGELAAISAAADRYRVRLEKEAKAEAERRAEAKAAARRKVAAHADFLREWLASPRVASRVPRGLDIAVQDDGDVSFTIDGEVVEELYSPFNNPKNIHQVLVDWGKFFRFALIAPYTKEVSDDL